MVAVVRNRLFRRILRGFSVGVLGILGAGEAVDVANNVWPTAYSAD